MSREGKKNKKPEWAQKFEERGREYSRTNREDYRGVGRILGHLFAVLWLVIFFYVINKYYGSINFLTDDFKAILWLLNISLVFAIFSNLLQAFVQSSFLRHFLGFVGNIVSIIIFYTAYVIFPFNASGDTVTLTRVILIFMIFGTGIGMIVDFVKMLRGKN